MFSKLTGKLQIDKQKVNRKTISDFAIGKRFLNLEIFIAYYMQKILYSDALQYFAYIKYGATVFYVLVKTYS